MAQLGCSAAEPADTSSAPRRPASVPPTEASIARERPIVFVSSRATRYGQLYLAKSDGSDPQRIADTRSGAVDPVWAPDGRSLAFRQRLDLGDGRFRSQLLVASADGSQTVLLAEEDAVSFDFESTRPNGGISWSPDGTTLAYAWATATGQQSILLMSRSGGLPHALLPALADAHFSPSFARTGAARLAYIAAIDGVRDIFLVNPEHPSEPQNLTRGRVLPMAGLRWSPTAEALAFAALQPEPPAAGDDEEIYVLDLATLALAQITDNDASDTHPTWTPDGTSLLLGSDRQKRAEGARDSALFSDLWLVPLDDPEAALNLSPGGGGNDNEADWFWETDDSTP